MADTPKKKRRVVKQAKPETVRERASKSSNTEEKPRRVKHHAKKAGKPFAALGHILAKVFGPFGFLLRPFKTRPARAIGRLLAKVLLINYIRRSWQELRLVEWPDRRQTAKLTVAVFVFAFAIAGFVAGADWVLDKLLREILLS